MKKSLVGLLLVLGFIAGCSDSEPSLEGQWRLVKSTGKDAAFDGFKLQGNSFEISIKSVSCAFKASATKDSIGVSSPTLANAASCPSYNVSFKVDRKNENLIQLSAKSGGLDFEATYERVGAPTGGSSSPIDGLSGDSLKAYFTTGKTVGISKDVSVSGGPGMSTYFVNGASSSTPPSSGTYCSIYTYDPLNLKTNGVIKIESAPYTSSGSFYVSVRYSVEGSPDMYFSISCYGNGADVTGKTLSDSFQGILKF